MNSPGALNVKASVKTRDHGSRREHCISREPPRYYFGKRVLLPEYSCRWPWSDVFSTWTLLPGAASTKGYWIFFLRKRPCAVRNYYWSERRFIDRNKTEKPSDESPTDQEHRPEDRAEEAHRARLIARSMISFGCLSLVKSVFVSVYCFFLIAVFKSSCVFLRQQSATCTALHCVENTTCTKRQLFVRIQVLYVSRFRTSVSSSRVRNER